MARVGIAATYHLERFRGSKFRQTLTRRHPVGPFKNPPRALSRDQVHNVTPECVTKNVYMADYRPPSLGWKLDLSGKLVQNGSGIPILVRYERC